ncbi:WD40/YVTN/BNR-like repeat-containing protein [Salibacter halophilus]|uniref:Glycosyl hydrolase n=1 Tax=Salibacter halophilus TaxID=1803916 RepID=A0A6N6M4X5_9FLAO|nr:glycosyl hydrolase [Salibacter halophilus]KAB1064435.1 glycosyl hydrolase [Salibacter halophilus]
MKIKLLLLSLIFSSSILTAQKSDYFLKSSDLNAFSFRTIGPALTSGRISDIAVHPQDKDFWYIAAASGGVWKTTNHGVNFTPIFDSEGSYSIGCVTIDPNNPHTVWVGTGENNNQRSVAYGDGIYKSTDDGKSWKNMGLKNSEHIGMIAVHPNNSDIVYVAAYGPLWSKGGDRGLYKTTDGGENWTKILDIDEYTGVNEVHLDPRNPDVIYATAHQRMRKVFTYISGGPGSGIFKSTDGGESFEELKSGLPVDNMGRIGMDISPVNPDVLYAIIEGKYDKEGVYKSTDRGASWNKVDDYVTSGNYYQELFCDPQDVDKVYSMDTYAHFTEDGGNTWKKLPEDKKHVDNHAMWINPDNTDHYLMGCDGGLYGTFDNGKNWEFYTNLPITQFYRVSVDRSEPFYNIYGGTQDNFSLGGPSQTRKSSGIDNYDWFVTNNGDGFESQVDPENPNIVYAQAQYGWLVRFDRNSGQKVGIQPQPPKGEAYRWNWDAPLIISPHDNKTLYFAANKVFKTTDRGNSWEVISDDLTQQIDRNKLKVMGRVWGVDAIMKNKSTTIYGNITALTESPKVKGLLYAGTDDGLIQVKEPGSDQWKKLSKFPDIPERTFVYDVEASLHDENTVFAVFNNHKEGDFKPYILKSENKGKSWKSISGDLPERGSVYSIVQDHKNPDLLFAGTEFGVFVTLNDGKNWVQLKNGLPTIAIRDLTIQRDNEALVLGSFGRGFYVLDDYSPLRAISKEKLNEEATFLPTPNGLIYPEENRYGYSGVSFQSEDFWTAKNPEQGVNFYLHLKEDVKTLKAKRRESEKEKIKDKEDVYYPSFDELRAEDQEEKPYLILTIRSKDGEPIRRLTNPIKKGINKINWDGQIASISGFDTKGAPLTEASGAFFALPGDYTVDAHLSKNGEVSELLTGHKFSLKALNLNTLPVDKDERNNILTDIEQTRKKLYEVNRFHGDFEKRVKEVKSIVRDYPGSDLEDLTKLREMEKMLDSLDIILTGDKSLSSREFETEPSLTNRIGIAVYQTYNTQNNPTETQQKAIELVKNELWGIQKILEGLKRELTSIESKLKKQGAPLLKDELPDRIKR